MTSATEPASANLLLDPSISQRLTPAIGAIGLAIDRAHMNPDERARFKRSISHWMTRWQQRKCCCNCALSQVAGICSLREGVRCEDAKLLGIEHKPPSLSATSSQRQGKHIDVRALLALADYEVADAVLGCPSGLAPALTLETRDGWVVSAHCDSLTLHRKIRGGGSVAVFREKDGVAVKMLSAAIDKETAYVTGIPGTRDVIASVIRALECSPSGWPGHVRWSELENAAATLIGMAATAEASHPRNEAVANRHNKNE